MSNICWSPNLAAGFSRFRWVERPAAATSMGHLHVLGAIDIRPRRLFDQATSFVSVTKPSLTYSLVGIRRMSSVT